MNKTPYLGNELRIDGYYYSNIAWYDKYTDRTYIGISIFYRDGFCIHTWGEPVNQDTLKCIENEILLNDSYIDKIKKEPSHIGTFQIMYPNIEFEVWEFRTDPFSHYGTILNDTTFIINKRVNNRIKETYTENLIYKFVPFSPKPDSTNVFVK
jgi:hypothetical protein